MTQLNTMNSRGNNRRVTERRIACRRLIHHPFGSEQWVEAVGKANLMWPKHDRRQQDRRSMNRRSSERRTRTQQHRRWSLRQQTLLTPEEIRLLTDIN